MAAKDNYRSDMIDFIIHYSMESDMNVIVQTSGSTIIGTPISDESINPLFDTLMSDFVEHRSEKIKELQNDPEVLLSTKAIFLKDVTIMSPQTIKVPILIVFVDEISAISLGNISD